jgi:hypothetical protein
VLDAWEIGPLSPRLTEALVDVLLPLVQVSTGASLKDCSKVGSTGAVSFPTLLACLLIKIK